MKKMDLEKQLAKLGWKLDRHGGNHDVWAKGDAKIPIPRHKEVNELTAKSILKSAKKI